MEKEFHLYLCGYNKINENRFDGLDEVNEAIRKGISPIKTTQVLACTTELFSYNYRIFVHDEDGEFEITLGNCERTTREIRMAHNLPKLIQAGEFRL